MSLLLRRCHDDNDDVEELEKPTADSTVKEIKSYLTSEQIEFDERAKKDELLALIE